MLDLVFARGERRCFDVTPYLHFPALCPRKMLHLNRKISRGLRQSGNESLNQSTPPARVPGDPGPLASEWLGQGEGAADVPQLVPARLVPRIALVDGGGDLRADRLTVANQA